MFTTHDIERKGTDDISIAFDDFMQAFEAFKAANDERLESIEKRVSADVVTTDKLERINRALDDLTLKSRRPLLGASGGVARSALSIEHRNAFDTYVRKGESGTLRELEGKALSVGSDPDGGYLVPEETEAAVNRALKDISPIRAISGVRQVSGSIYKRPFAVSGPDTGWIGETAARVETATPTLAELSFPTMELYAMPAATSSLLDDSAVDIDAWLAEEVRIAFAEQEGQAFVAGDGVNKPKGFLSYTTVDNAAWEWGKVGVLTTGVAGDFAASNPGDILIDLIYAVRSGYRANAHFVMNRSTQAEIRKLKDNDGHYLWQPGARPGEAPSLLGFPVAEAEDMPDIAADALAVAFGDFRRGYLIVDRLGIRVLRDPYSAKPYVLFYTTKRVGGGIQDFDAIKLLQFSA
ncbi:phage major capsid protein [Filomicrobium sp.]|uniref:phage major capsid protein n=1 Tax=Filomicrobium sp. TaxID=2024831 RepID=UPI0025902498|nr:phage major capsid protein [Filomicrobium sp.]MCV0370819.1 phage major capsid protein [Filomicrobium sp.]